MHKNNRKRPTGTVPSSLHQAASTSKVKHLLDKLRDIIGLIAAATSIFAVMFYLAGRSFASGYFAAMNIPSYQVNFSLWEYGESAWMPLFLYPILITLVSSLLGGVTGVIKDLTVPWRRALGNWIKRKIKFRIPGWQFPQLSYDTKLWFSITNHSFTALLLIFELIVALVIVMWFGGLIGKSNVLNSSTQIELISTYQLAIDDKEYPAEQDKKQNYYIYTDLYLLTFNNGKYYLFKEINQDTCKPKKVYVIDSSQSLQVNLLPAKSLKKQCRKDANSQVIMTPTPAQLIP